MAMWIGKYNKLIGSRWFWIAFVFLVAISFIFTFNPAADVGGNQPSYAGKLNGEKVSFEELNKNRAFVELTLALREQSSQGVDLDDRAWKRIAQLREADNMGIVVPVTDIQRAISGLGFFRNQQGQFDPNAYNQVMGTLFQEFRITKNDFDTFIEQEIKLQRLQGLVFQTIKVPPSEINEVYHDFNDTFTATYLVVSPSDVDQEVVQTEEDIRAYYDSNSEQFREPDRVKALYTFIAYDDFRDEVTLDEEEIEAVFEANRDYFSNLIATREAAATNDLLSSEIANLSLETDTNINEDVIVDTEEEFTNTVASMTNAITSTLVSSTNTDDSILSATTNLLDEAPLAEIETNVSETVVETEEEATDLLLGDDLGFVEPETLGDDLYAKARPIIVSNLTEVQIRRKAVETADLIAIEVIQEDVSFLMATTNKGLAIAETPLFSPSEAPVLDPAFNFGARVFQLETNREDRVSSSMAGSNGVYIAYLEQKIPSHIPAFETIQPIVEIRSRQDVIQQRLTDKASELRDELQARLKEGEVFSGIVADLGLNPVNLPEFSRSQSEAIEADPFYNAIMREIATLDSAELSPIVTAGSSRLLIYVKNRIVADEGQLAEQKDFIQQQLRQNRATAVINDYNAYLLEKMDFELNVPTLESPATDEEDADQESTS